MYKRVSLKTHCSNNSFLLYLHLKEMYRVNVNITTLPSLNMRLIAQDINHMNISRETRNIFHEEMRANTRIVLFMISLRSVWNKF